MSPHLHFRFLLLLLLLLLLPPLPPPPPPTWTKPDDWLFISWWRRKELSVNRHSVPSVWPDLWMSICHSLWSTLKLRVRWKQTLPSKWPVLQVALYELDNSHPTSRSLQMHSVFLFRTFRITICQKSSWQCWIVCGYCQHLQASFEIVHQIRPTHSPFSYSLFITIMHWKLYNRSYWNNL
jgi:hypothetical protein